MERERVAAGQVLRHLRHRRGLTLKQAAEGLHTSAPVLSRKERGEDTIERHDIRLAVRSFQLSPWEAYELWTSAGFLPEPGLPLEPASDLQSLAERLLPHIAFPAFIMDSLGYLRAWNQDFEAIWEPSRAERAPVHLVDDLFSQRQRQRLGDLWEGYAAQTLKIFYRKTLRVASDPAFRALLDDLHSRHGDEFVQKWNQAQQTSAGLPLASEVGGTVVLHDSPFESIEFLIVQSIFQLPQEYDLIVYVPFGGANHDRYRQAKASVVPNRLYVGF
jgi:transcriptional regulator with XRE-family HTH domain